MFYLIPAELKIVPVFGKDLEGDGFVILGLFQFF